MNFVYNQLVPELNVRNLEKSLSFYIKILGFSLAYQRKESGFAFITLDETQIMLGEIGKGRDWNTGELEYPLGRGINFEIGVESIKPLLKNLQENNIKLFVEPEEQWYRRDDKEVGNRQFLVLDPDGYLLRFSEELGERAVSEK